MRGGSLSLLAFLFALILTACGDLPTASRTDRPGADRPMLSGECIPNSEGVFVCPPISGGPTCDPYHYDCGPGDCMTSAGGADDETIQSCPGSGGSIPVGPGAPRPPGGEGGGTSPPDTCRTGDQVLDSPAVRRLLNDLWQASNPTASQPQRVEQAAWIIQNPDGSFGTVPFTGITSQGPCGINGNFYAPPNAVAWVHTHPFRRGEVQVTCPPVQRLDPLTGSVVTVRDPSGRPVYPVYGNRPSDGDYSTLEAINNIQEGKSLNLLAGVIIDQDLTTVFTEDSAEKPVPFPRCGY